jgi:hypothetical protein
MRKLQVFVSSTFEDLKPERQAAVEAILEAGHIPAGMELFTAGDESQLDTIKTWIGNSDVFVLLLGGRYGSIEPKSQKSYVQLEYEFALELSKPAFAVVVTEEALDAKTKTIGRGAIEQTNGQLLQQFRSAVLSKTSRFFADTKDIKIAIHQKLAELAQRKDLVGWIRGDQASNEKLASELAALSEENRSLRSRLEAAGKNSSASDSDGQFGLPPNLADDDIVAVLKSALKQMPSAKRFSVLLFEHVDKALGLAPGSSKRLLRKAGEGLYDVAMETPQTITFQEPRPRATAATVPRRDRGL